ncbi:MAG TPA: SCE4755 family polysaccharide monooxygenase-like protein [Polyangiaceae bacterium]|nr:SCE4755 family polysaccharide monooxygenase-like protein [Polyangiaceae bacterium]
MKTVANALLAGALPAAAVLFAPATAEAHFVLNYPPSYMSQDVAGNPQKAMPCGIDSAALMSVPPPTATNAVTTFAPGQQVMLEFTEEVAHTGWYRVSISYKADLSDLTDPDYQVYAANSTQGVPGWSEDASIEDPTVPPVLLDGILKHEGTIATPHMWTYPLTIPDMPCDKCTLQVEQIMLDHPVNQADGQYTYHHCANIRIVAGADGGVTAKGADGGTIAVEPDSGIGTTAPFGSSSGTGSTSGGTASGGSTSGASGDDATTGNGSSDNGSSGEGSSGDAGNGSSGGCDASGRGTTAAAGLGLLAGAAVAGMRRRRRRPQ